MNMIKDRIRWHEVPLPMYLLVQIVSFITPLALLIVPKKRNWFFACLYYTINGANKIRSNSRLCTHSHIFARRTVRKYVTDKLISLSLPLTSSPIIFQLYGKTIKISFRLKHFERRAIRVKGLNKSKISYLINTVMAEFKCLHNSSYLRLVYT